MRTGARPRATGRSTPPRSSTPAPAPASRRDHRARRRARSRDDARPEPSPARPRQAQAALAGVTKIIGDAEALPFAPTARPLRLDRQHRVLARSAARDRRGLPGPAARRGGAARRPLRRTHRWRARCRTPGGSSRRGGVRSVVRARGVRPHRARARRARWWDPAWDPYAVAIAGVKPAAGEPPALAPAPPGPPTRTAASPPRAWRGSPSARWRARPSSRWRCGSGPLALEQRVDDLALPLALDYSFSISSASLRMPSRCRTRAEASLRASRRPITRCTRSSSKARASSAAAASVA